MAVVFAAATVYALAASIASLTAREVRSGLLVYGAATGACAAGLWRMRSWGRSLAIVVALGNAGLGTLTLLAAILASEPTWGPAVFLGVNVAVAFALTRPVFGGR